MLSKEEVRQGSERKFVNTKTNGHIVKLLLDRGSDISIIDEVTWKRIGCPKLEKTFKIAKGVSGKRLKLKGEFILQSIPWIENFFFKSDSCSKYKFLPLRN